MDNQEILYEYSESVKRIKKQCLETGMSEENFKTMYFESLNSLNGLEPQSVRQNNREFSRRIQVIFIAIVLLCTAYNYKTIYSCLVCKLQDYVYPGLRLLRRMSIPFVSLFPSISSLYYESCLIQNPFFAVADMDCWPCSTVSNVGEINNPEPVHQQHSAPFIYETNQQVIDLKTLKDLYEKHKNVFDKETNILVNNKLKIKAEEIFHRAEDTHDKGYYIWRFNNMNAARALRQVIPKPKVVPKFGQSIERFLVIDSSQNSFAIPETECNFSFLLALSGSRLVHLIPAEECKTQCKSLKIELRETFLLWYNWWYWRPVIESSNVNTTLIAHVGSYC